MSNSSRHQPRALFARQQQMRRASHPGLSWCGGDPRLNEVTSDRTLSSAGLSLLVARASVPYRPIYEGNNTVGRGASNRIAIDFGDDTISSDEQAYIRYDSANRAFLFVPNMAKTNIVSVNDDQPTSATRLQSKDVIRMGRTQLVFVAFCGADFDWSDIAELKKA